MSEVVSKVSTNVKDRFNAITKIPEAGKNTLMAAKEDVLALRPLKAIVTVLKGAGDGVLDAVDENLDITRRWI